MRYEVVSGTEYPVYSPEEADDLGLSYKHPFDVSEGEYGLSSDNEVGLCLKRSTTKNKYINIKYPWGPSFISSDKDNVQSLGRLNNYTISGKNNRGKFIRNRDDFQRLAYLMAQPGLNKKVAIDMIFGSIPPGKKTEIKRTMRTEVFKQMTREELDKLIEQFPIGRHDTARALAAILDKSMDYDEETGKPGKGYDPKAALAVTDKLMDMNDMKGKGKVVVTQQIEASTVEHTLADIQEKKKLFKATQTEEKHGLEQTAEKKEESNQEEA